ncbi:MAG: hypothetical protein GY820_39775 [Gammaproteobacteria bacterium]|nr:hypothetical protein [Gammaproteobacteria bacterium]
MAELVQAVGAQNYYGLSAQFGTNDSEETPGQQFVPKFGADGDFLCSQEFDLRTDYTQTADYCDGGAPNIMTHLSTLMSTFGSVQSAKQPTKVEITFKPGEGAEVNIDGHQHTTNPHTALNTFNVSGIVPAGSGTGVPDIITVAGTVSPVETTITYEIEHIDKVGAAGTHFEGQNIRCHVSLSVGYSGQPSGVTAGDWLNIILVKSAPNDDTPTAALTAEQWVDKI